MKMRWVGQVQRIEEQRNAHKILYGKPEWNTPLGDVGVGGRLLLNWNKEIICE
jgi:hypothetical protein